MMCPGVPAAWKMRQQAVALERSHWVSLLDNEDPEYELLVPGVHLWWLEQSWVKLFENGEEDILNYLVIDTARRALEVARALNSSPEIEIAELTRRINRFDHLDERYLCDWTKERRSEYFLYYILKMIDSFEDLSTGDRYEAAARFRSMVIQSFSNIEGCRYRRGREMRRDGFTLADSWWVSFLPRNHPKFRSVYPSSALVEIEEKEFSGPYQADLYEGEDTRSYRSGSVT